MTQTLRDPLYRRHRFPAEVIAHAVWLYLRFPLSLSMVEDVLAARGIIVSHQTVRLWAEKFGRLFANEIRRKSEGRLGDKWYLDEVVISIGGKKQWLWRAVDQDGFVLDVLVQSRRNTKAAKRLIAKTSERTGPHAARHDHRQAAILWRCKARNHARRRTSFAQGIEQPGREFPSTDTTSRARYEGFQVNPTSPAVRLHSRPGRQSLSHSTPRYPLRPSPRAENCRHANVERDRSSANRISKSARQDF